MAAGRQLGPAWVGLPVIGRQRRQAAGGQAGPGTDLPIVMEMRLAAAGETGNRLHTHHGVGLQHG